MSKTTRPQKKDSKATSAKRKPTPGSASAKGGVAVAGNVHCADFIGRDQVKITYGYSPADLERLVDKVLAFLQAGAMFVPRDDALYAEANGEKLAFYSGAAQKLAGRRNEKSYLLSLAVQRDFCAWATYFVPLEADIDVRREIEGMYVPIAYDELIPPPEGSGPGAQLTPERLPDITQALNKHVAFVILGEPGAGKTTTLQKIAFETARARLSGQPGRVPLFVRLSQQRDRLPFDFMRAEWEQRTSSDFADAWAAGRVLVLADGINELPRGDVREQQLKDWRIWTGDHLGANQIIFTSREHDYKAQLNLPRVRVVPLDDQRIADYLRRNHAEELEARLDDPKANLREIARNPFYLMLLTGAFRTNQHTLNNRGRLLEGFARWLFKREEDQAHPGWLPRDAQMAALSRLAFKMQDQGESLTFPLKQAQAALPETVEVDGEEVAVKSANLFSFARAATILDPAIEPDVRFYHHLLQEYFAALELLRQLEASQAVDAASSLALSPADRTELYREVVARFNKDELDTLCFDLGVDHESLPSTRTGLARELIALCERRGSILDLVAACQKRNSDFSWEDTRASSAARLRQDLRRLWKCKRLAHEMPTAEVGEWDALPEPPATGWEVTTILACGLARDPARLIEAVRPHNPVLAGRCLDEAGLPGKPEDVAAKVRTDLLHDLYDPAIHLRARLQAGFTLGCIGDPRFQSQVINGIKVILPTMVQIPAGDYVIGSAENEPNSYDDEKPQHTVKLGAFEMGRWPVTNGEFACFMEVGGYKDGRYWTTDLAKRWLKGEDVTGGQMTGWMDIWKFMQSNVDWKERFESTGSFSPDDLKGYERLAAMKEDEFKVLLSRSLSAKSREQPQWWKDSDRNNPSQPVVGVTWFEAQAYCRWLSVVTGQVYRLPTEVEWEAAVRGSSLPLSKTGEGPGMRVRVYPWGDDWDASHANTIEGRVLKPSPVGTYKASGGLGPFEAEDQAGNVWEWTSSLYRPYPYRPDDREDAEAEGERTVRGVSWDFIRGSARCAGRLRVRSRLLFLHYRFSSCVPWLYF